MKKILALTGSNSKNSINQQLLTYTATLFEMVKLDVLDIHKMDIPIYGIDRERVFGIPEPVISLINNMRGYDGFIIASPEHNGQTTAFFKNLLDWMSRYKRNFLSNKPLLLMSTSPGGKGGANNLEIMKKFTPFWGASTTFTYSLPFFRDNFDTENGLLTPKSEKLKLMGNVTRLESLILDLKFAES